MIRPPGAIRTATSAEAPQVVSVIVAAFVTDPLTRFAWPSVHDYLQHMPRATREFGGAAFANPEEPHWYLPMIGVERARRAGASARSC